MWTASAGTICSATVCLFLRNTLGNPLGPIRNENFSLVELDCTWIFKKSHSLTGSIECHAVSHPIKE